MNHKVKLNRVAGTSVTIPVQNVVIPIVFSKNALRIGFIGLFSALNALNCPDNCSFFGKICF